MSNQGLNLHTVSSLLGDGDEDPTKEADAALVDSFFLPGGLFSDEGNSNHQPEAVPNNNLRIRPSLQESLNAPLSQNPWESKTSNVIASQVPMSARREAKIEPLPMQQLRQGTRMKDHQDYHNNKSDDAFNLGGRFRNANEGTILEQPRMDNSQFQPLPGLILSDTRHNPPETIHDVITTNRASNNSSRLVRPPPGFRNSPTVAGSVDAAQAKDLNADRNTLDFLPSAGTNGRYQGLFPSSDDNHKGAAMNKNRLVGAGNAPGPIPTRSNLYDNDTRKINGGSLLSNHQTTSDQAISESKIPQAGFESDDNIGKGKSNSYLAHYLKDSIPTQNTPDRGTNQENDAPETLQSVSDESKGTSQKSKDYTPEDYVDEDVEGDVPEEDDIDDEELEENSIPSSICVSIGAESNSSLSTSSEVDNSEISSQGSGQVQNIKNDNTIDEGIGYDTDQAHVSQIADVVGNSLCSTVKIPGDEQYESPAPSAKSEARTSDMPSADDNILHREDGQNNFTFTAEKLATLLQAVMEICFSFGEHSLSALRELLNRIKTTKSYEQFSQQSRKLSQDLDYLTNWLMDVREVFTVLLLRLLDSGRKHSRGMIEAITILFSALSQLFKFSKIEALEEFSGVTSSYVVFRLIPNAWVMIMDYINLPHWTPHTVSWLAIFALCQQVEDAPLYDTSNISFPSLLMKLLVNISIVPENCANEDVFHQPGKSKNTQNLPPRQHHNELARAQDKQLCFLLFKTIKTVLPVLYMVEGFSSEFGTVLSLRGSNRMIAAFVMAVFRKSILSSPIAWVSWALQVLLATLFRSSVLLDVLLLSIGLSSIRLIRFLDQQKSLEKELREKSNK